MIVTLALVLASAQQPPAALAIYRQAVESYQSTRRLDDARRLVGEWTRRQFEEAVAAEVRSSDRHRLEAAAVLHLEIALGVSLANPDGALLHIGLGEQLLRARPAPPAAAAPDDGRDAFTGRWYAVAASGFVAQTDTLRARPIIERGLTRAPDSAALRLVSGIVEEMDATRLEPDVTPGRAGVQVAMRRNARAGMEGLARLALAEREYRRALEDDPDLAHAWLRLGRVLHQRGQTATARDALDRARQLGRRPADQLLVRLFLGDLEAADDVDAARRWFEAAWAGAPGVQSAWLALAQLEEREGHADRARRITREGLTGPRLAADPWWDYRNGGLDVEGLAWLRARVQH